MPHIPLRLDGDTVQHPTGGFLTGSSGLRRPGTEILDRSAGRAIYGAAHEMNPTRTPPTNRASITNIPKFSYFSLGASARSCEPFSYCGPHPVACFPTLNGCTDDQPTRRVTDIPATSRVSHTS